MRAGVAAGCMRSGLSVAAIAATSMAIFGAMTFNLLTVVASLLH